MENKLSLTVDRYVELIRYDQDQLIRLVRDMTQQEKKALRSELERLNFPYYLRHLYFDFNENKWF